MGITLALGSDPCEATEDRRTFSFYFENNFFADTDQYYTNGIKLSWISSDNKSPNGWDNQLNNEPGLSIVYERKWKFFYDKAISTTATL